MPKLSEIFDTPEAISRVGGNEKLKLEFIQKWDSGQFEWNHHEGDELGIKPNSLWRVWNEFIEPALTTKDQEKEEAIAKARDQEAKLWFETWYSHYISPTKPLAGEFARFATERIQMTGYERDQALPTEDNK